MRPCRSPDPLLLIAILSVVAVASGQQLLANSRCNHWPDRGTCEFQFAVKWYYDRYDHRCRRFYYGGCDGNENRFDSQNECQQQCHYEEPSERDRCFQPHNPGHCNADIERWYFDQDKRQCVCSWWSGCGGNSNIYYSYNHCMLICGQFADPTIGPGIDQEYWSRKSNESMSADSRMVFANPEFTGYNQRGPYSVQVPRNESSQHRRPQFLQFPRFAVPEFNQPHHQNSPYPQNMFMTINITHNDDASHYHEHKKQQESMITPEYLEKMKGVTIQRYDSQPRQMTELEAAKLLKSSGPEYHTFSLPMKKRYRVQRKKVPPRIIHLNTNPEGPAVPNRNTLQQQNSYQLHYNSEGPTMRQVENNMDQGQGSQDDQASHQLARHHQQLVDAAKANAEETRRKLEETIRNQQLAMQQQNLRRQIQQTSMEPHPQHHPQQPESHHPEIVEEFRSYLEDHEKSLRKKLEAQFPDHVITLIPQIETVRNPDGRNIVRQRIQWTAHPKAMNMQINQNQHNMPYQPQVPAHPVHVPTTQATQTQIPTPEVYTPPTEPMPREIHAVPHVVATPPTLPPTVAAEVVTTVATVSPHHAARAEMLQKHIEEQEKRRQEQVRLREEHMKKMKEHQEKQIRERERMLREHEEKMAQRRKQYEEELKNRMAQQITITTTPTPTTVIQTTAVYDDRIYLPTVTQPVPFLTVPVNQPIYDVNVHKPTRPTPTRQPARTHQTAEPVEHFRPIIEQVTSAPLSIEDIIAMDNARDEYEGEYDVPMDFPDTERTPKIAPTRAAPLPPPPPTHPPVRQPPSHQASGLAAIVSPPNGDKKKSRLFEPVDSDEYAQTLDFARFADF